jgi:hypothetical protein
MLTLTETLLARAAQVTFGIVQESAGSTDAVFPMATLCPVIGTLTPFVLCQCPQAHPYFLQNAHLTLLIPGLNYITPLRSWNGLSGQLSVRLRST